MDNVAQNTGGIVFGYLANARVINCILKNFGEEVFIDRSTPELTFSCIEGGWPGPGNISTDPMFVDSANGDYRLLPNSPCIDSGTRVDLFDDIEDNPRPVDIPGVGREGDNAFDMGAYEYPLGGYPTPTPTVTATPTPFTPADLNVDNTVNAADLMRILRGWHTEVQDASPEDLHHDGLLNLLDLAIFQQHWGETTGVQ